MSSPNIGHKTNLNILNNYNKRAYFRTYTHRQPTRKLGRVTSCASRYRKRENMKPLQHHVKMCVICRLGPSSLPSATEKYKEENNNKCCLFTS